MPPNNLEINNNKNTTNSAGKVCIFNANVKIEKVMVWKLKMQLMAILHDVFSSYANHI
jgi:hypothetical protein